VLTDLGLNRTGGDIVDTKCLNCAQWINGPDFEAD